MCAAVAVVVVFVFCYAGCAPFACSGLYVCSCVRLRVRLCGLTDVLMLLTCAYVRGPACWITQFSKLLHKEGFPTKLTRRRGLDHGAFIPLISMYPSADIPVVQLSLRDTMDFSEHVAVGKLLAQYRRLGTMIICACFLLLLH